MNFTDVSLNVLKNAKDGICSLEQVVISDQYKNAIDVIFYTKGKIIFTGVGKSGHIASKMAATMASLGKCAIFIHPTEASHGDLGMISKDDCIIALSKSGQSIELEDIIRYSQSKRIPVISLTMKKDSFLGKESNIPIVLEDVKDGCLEINAPMTSTTMMLVLGDCLAASIASKIEFKKNSYSIIHPGGKLGKSMTKIKYIMRTGERIPLVEIKTKISDVIVEITEKMLGIVGIVDFGKIVGVITDGDIRRNIADKDFIFKDSFEIMTKNFKYLTEDMFLDQAVEFLVQSKITSSIVLNEEMKPIGAVNIHDLLNFSSGR